jgi:acetyltransferase-like isoleucine patch superfamily enzyme
MNPVRFLRKGLRVVRAAVFYRLVGVRHAGMPYIHGMLPRVDGRGEIVVGRRFKVDGLQFRADFGAGPAGRLLLGHDVFLNRGSTIFAAERIEIGDNTRIADHVTIHDTNFHEIEEAAPVTTSPVTIGRNVWIGRNAIVLPGVSIGDHAADRPRPHRRPRAGARWRARSRTPARRTSPCRSRRS